MSKSFQIINGDLVVGVGRAYGSISGKDKLQQDLKMWVLEKIGSDSLLPTYGSALDGGIIDGQVIPSFVGELLTPDIISQIRAEILRILTNYQAMQYQKMQDEAILYGGKNTLSADEVVDTIDSVSVLSVGETILVQAIVTTLTGSSLTLTVPLTPEN